MLALIAPHLSAVVLLRGGEAVTRQLALSLGLRALLHAAPHREEARHEDVDRRRGRPRGHDARQRPGSSPWFISASTTRTRIVLIAAMVLAGLGVARLHAPARRLRVGPRREPRIRRDRARKRRHGGPDDAEDARRDDGAPRCRKAPRPRRAVSRARRRTRQPERRSFHTDDLGARAAELRSGDTARTRAALTNRSRIPSLRRDPAPRERCRGARCGPRAAQYRASSDRAASDALLDHDVDVRVRRRLPRVLKVCRTERAAAGLFMALADPVFDVRTQVALVLTEMQDAGQVVVAARRCSTLPCTSSPLATCRTTAERNRRLGHVFTRARPGARPRATQGRAPHHPRATIHVCAAPPRSTSR